MEFTDYLDRLRKNDPELAREFTGFDGITQVLDWMKQRGVGREAIDFVSHDELNYDFLIHLRPKDKWVVFGVN
jgi:hypothetical protein